MQKVETRRGDELQYCDRRGVSNPQD